MTATASEKAGMPKLSQEHSKKINLFLTTVLRSGAIVAQLAGPCQKLWACSEAVSRERSYVAVPDPAFAAKLSPSQADLLNPKLHAERYPGCFLFLLFSLFFFRSFFLSFFLHFTVQEVFLSDTKFQS